jgi:Tfp pilus assembly protein PilX
MREALAMTARSRSAAMRLQQNDRGAALITVLLLLMALTAVTTTVAVVTTSDTVSAGRDRQAAGALATADAGVAQGLEYIRYNGLNGLNCPVTNTSSCSSNPPGWSSPTSPKQIRLDGSSGDCTASLTCFKVWIGVVTAYNPPAVKTGVYRIHSTGFSGSGPGAKAVIVDVAVTPLQFPIGVYGDELTGNGGTRISNEMLFTQDCVSPRYTGSGNGTRFQGLDPYWDEPASASSTTFVSTSNNCGANGFLHNNTSAGACPNNTQLNYDRTSRGATLPSGSPCRTYTKADGSTGTRDSTYFSLEILQEKYGFRPGGLSESEYEALRVRAQTLGTLNVANESDLRTKLQNLVAAGVTSPIVYWDNKSTVNLSSSDIPTAFSREPDSPCTAPYGVVVIVRNGDMVYQGGNNNWRSLALFVPEGNFRGDGGYNILGTLFAKNISLGGNEEFRLDSCFVDNLPGTLLNLDVLSFREDDRQDIR